MANIKELSLNDDFGLSGAVAYIYTKGSNWFILHYRTEQKAIANCPEGYSVNEYRTTTQIPY